MYIKRDITIIGNSKNADNLTADGSSFTINLQNSNGLGIDKKNVIGDNVKLSISKALVWFNTPNISPALGNRLRFDQKDSGDVLLNSYDFVFPTGLYTVDDLNNKIIELIGNDTTITIDTNAPEQKIKLILDRTGDKKYDFYWDDVDSIAPLLGFDKVLQSYATDIVQSNNTPRFNTIEYYNIRGNIVNSGLQENGKNTGGILAFIPIDTSPNSQIQYQPLRPSYIDDSTLAGSSQQVYKFTLTDNNGDPVDTRGETWSFELQISYMKRERLI